MSVKQISLDQTRVRVYAVGVVQSHWQQFQGSPYVMRSSRCWQATSFQPVTTEIPDNRRSHADKYKTYELVGVLYTPIIVLNMF